MGGENPYLKQAAVRLPTRPYTVTFVSGEERRAVQVDPAALPSGTGRPGSLLATAMGAGVQIDHACGGVCACSTCHVLVREGVTTLNEASEEEEDMLDNAPGLEACSRLACQAVPDGTQDLVVEVPAWNRNLVREGH